MDLIFDGFSSFLRSGFFSLFGVGTGDGEADASGLGEAVLATFAFARLSIGYLNLATAFLSSIVIGNGINVGILVTARYLEELRAGKSTSEALAAGIERTIAGKIGRAHV